jgi:RNA polymerase sigma-70 factor (ECF subfamily)
VEQRLYDVAEPNGMPPGMGAIPPSADAAVQSEEARTLIDRAVATLPEPYRQVLALRSEHQLSYPEIAAVLQIPLKTVESRVTRAFRTLREALRGLR